MKKNETRDEADAAERGEFHPTDEVWISPNESD